MKIFVTGTRGIPDIPGGVEKHCQCLYPLITQAGHEVILATRRSYVKEKKDEWKGVRLIHLYSPKRKSLEAIVHTFLAILKARHMCPDVLHIHAVGPCLMVPFARLLGLKVVITSHGPDYKRQKWGKFAKIMLRLGEYVGGKFANQVIVISTIISDIIEERCGRTAHVIPNGVCTPRKSSETDFLRLHNIKPRKYILAVARFVPEKGLHDLFAAFNGFDEDYELVIAGDADHKTDYSRRLRSMAALNNRIKLLGYVTGENLNQVFSHAGLFCLPSYHEGLPISLLEAMSYELPVLVSDIPANKEVGLSEDYYFRCGNIKELQNKMKQFIGCQVTNRERQNYKTQLQKKYNWKTIARQTINVYEKTIHPNGKFPSQ